MRTYLARGFHHHPWRTASVSLLRAVWSAWSGQGSPVQGRGGAEGRTATVPWILVFGATGSGNSSNAVCMSLMKFYSWSDIVSSVGRAVSEREVVSASFCSVPVLIWRRVRFPKKFFRMPNLTWRHWDCNGCAQNNPFWMIMTKICLIFRFVYK